MFNDSIEKISKQIEELEMMQANLEEVAAPAQKVLDDIKWVMSKLENYPKEKETFYRAVSEALGTELIVGVNENKSTETITTSVSTTSSNPISDMGKQQETSDKNTFPEFAKSEGGKLGENVLLLSELTGTAQENNEVILYIGFDKQKIRGGGETGCSTWKQAILERYDEAKITSGLASENSPIKKKWLTRVAGVTTAVINTLLTWDYSVAPEVFFARIEDNGSDVENVQIVDTNGHLQVPVEVVEQMEESNIPELESNSIPTEIIDVTAIPVVEEETKPIRKLDFNLTANNPRVGKSVVDGSFRLYIGFDDDSVEQSWSRYLIFNNPELCFAHYDGAESPLGTPQILEVSNLRETSLVKLIAYDYSQLPPTNSLSSAPVLQQPQAIDMFDVPVEERQEILEDLRPVEIEVTQLPAIDSSELLEAVTNTNNNPILYMGEVVENKTETIETSVEQVVVQEPILEVVENKPDIKQAEQFEAVDFNPDEMFQLL